MRVQITEWDAKKVIAEVSGRVVNGMDAACQFAVGVAKMKAPRATGRMMQAIDYEVVASGVEVEGRVGGRRNEAFYEYFVEMGTSRMGARPHLRPAVFENGATIVRLIEEG